MTFCDINPGCWIDVPARVFFIVAWGYAENPGEELARLSQSEIFVVLRIYFYSFTWIFV